MPVWKLLMIWVWLRRGLLFLLVFLFPLAYLLHLIFLRSDIEVLPPSWTGDWVVHPRQSLFGSRSKTFEDVLFCHVFRSAESRHGADLRVKAAGQATVTLDGDPVLSREESTWKEGFSVPLASLSAREGSRLCIRVSNPDSRPALLVQGPSDLRTPASWEAALGPEFEDPEPVLAASRAEVRLPPGLPAHSGPAPFRFWSDMRAALLLLIWGLVAGLGWWLLNRTPALGGIQKRLGRFVSKRLSTLVMAAAALLLLSNVLRYPQARSKFDRVQHLQYVQWLADEGNLPRPDQGFMMFQPPLYYLISAGLYRIGQMWGPEAALKAVQLLGSLFGFSLFLVAYLSVRLLWPQKEGEACLALVFAGLLPVCLYMNPIISNEVFAASVGAWAFYFLLRLFKAPSLRLSLAAGLVCGLALLSKYTALFLFLGGLALLGLQALEKMDRRSWLRLAVFVAAVFLCSGWLYLRNWALYQNPVIGSWDLFPFEQDPGFRTLGYYLRFGGVLLSHPELSPWVGWLDGLYGSMWGDVFRNLLSGQDWEYFWMGAVYWLALLPSGVILLGLADSLRCCLQRLDPLATLLSVTPIWMLQALMVYSFELPFPSAVKAFYFLALIPLLAVLLVRGRSILAARMPALRYLLDYSIFSIAFASGVLYQYRPL